jgi:hypothetical protein
MHRAFEVVNTQAERCLDTGDRVTVDGYFDGSSGGFFAERVGTASPRTTVATQQCVATVIERARVRPFSSPRHDARWTVTRHDVSAAVRAMLQADADTTTTEPMLGEIDTAAATAVFRASVSELRRCYEDALRGDPRLAGEVEFRLTVSIDGRVTHALTSGPRGFRAVGHCALGTLRARSWPAARRASVDLVFPMRFMPAH